MQLIRKMFVGKGLQAADSRNKSAAKKRVGRAFPPVSAEGGNRPVLQHGQETPTLSPLLSESGDVVGAILYTRVQARGYLAYGGDGHKWS